MYNHYTRILCSAVLSVSTLFFSGCTAAIVGAGETAYTHIRGDLLGIVPERLDDVYDCIRRNL